MKKIPTLLLAIGIIIGTLNVSALAASSFLATNSFFSDESTFADWFAPSAKKMQYNQIITGYSDDSFQGENPVSRAELAVILDRFSEKVVGKMLKNEPQPCTAQYVSGLEILLQDQNGNPIPEATITSSPNSEFNDGSNGQYSGLGEGKGYYTFNISKDGYSSHSESIKLEHNDCHVIPQNRTITLILKES